MDGRVSTRRNDDVYIYHGKERQMQKRITFFGILFWLIIALTGCDTLFPTPISKIIQNPRNYEGKQVMVSGKVVETFSLVVIRYFIIRDDTGEITVVTERSAPKKGEQIKVTGKVEEAFSLGDQQLIVIKENPAKN
jgi:hypothetical protein